jgi:hypothetical protein
MSVCERTLAQFLAQLNTGCSEVLAFVRMAAVLFTVTEADPGGHGMFTHDSRNSH